MSLNGDNRFYSFLGKVMEGKAGEASSITATALGYKYISQSIKKGTSPSVIEKQKQALKLIGLLPPNKKLIAEYYLNEGSSPLIAHAIGKFSSHIAKGIEG